MKHSLPVGPDDLTPDLLTELVSETYPGVRVETVRIVEAKGYGEVNVSTSARVKLQLEYAAGAPSTLPKHVVVKMSLDVDAWPGRLYTFFENEVNFYQRIRPELEIETPVALGGRFDPDTKRYCLILEDVGSRGAHFSSQNDEASIENTRSILETYAKLHATFWESPRFEDDLSFVQTHMKGGVEELMHGIVRDGIKDELSRQIVKRELVGRTGATEEEMYTGACALKRHQATLPQTLLHGDGHFGNTYRLPDGTGGLYDWQLSVKGYLIHDVSYMLTTSLSVELRRKHERELLAYYRDRLGHYGVASPPSEETLWLEHRRSSVWSFYYGWLTAPLPNYGWELLTIALIRTSTAFEDHETRKVIAQLT